MKLSNLSLTIYKPYSNTNTKIAPNKQMKVSDKIQKRRGKSAKREDKNKRTKAPRKVYINYQIKLISIKLILLLLLKRKKLDKKIF